MTNFTMQRAWVGSQPYVRAATRVSDWVSAPFAPEEGVDPVADAVEGRTDGATLSAAGELLAVEIDGPAVRWDRIEVLRERIAAGTYRVAALEIAAKMMDGMTRSFS